MGKLRASPKKRLNSPRNISHESASFIKTRNKKLRTFLIGAILGYLAGVILTYMWFLFFATQLNYSLKKSTNIGIILALLLPIGLAFNRTVRCVVILILPNFFSVKGRSALIAYAFVLAVTGPTKNTLDNVEVLSTSLSCGQEQVKDALKGMLEIVKRPLHAIKNVVKLAIRSLKNTVEKIEKILKMLMDLIKDLLKAIRKTFQWLGEVVTICNKQMGTPYQRCENLFEKGRKECKYCYMISIATENSYFKNDTYLNSTQNVNFRDQLGPLGFLCDVTYIVKTICYAVKFLDYVCILVDFVSDAIVGTVNRRLNIFVQEVRNIFYVSVKFDHKFNFTMHATKNLTEVGIEILADIRKHSRGLSLVMGWMEMLASLFILRIVLKSVIYKSKYLHHDRFDNTYITKDFVAVDGKRREMGKETVLPLTRKEGRKYVNITSCFLVRSEKNKLARSVMFLMITTIQLFTICLVDYSFFWLLWTIREHGRKMAGVEAPDFISVNVSGSGFIAEIYEGIINAFSPMAEKYNIDPIPCLPNPKTPKYDRYVQIGALILICWTFVIFEPYGLRLRQTTMRTFYPQRSKERAVWLHSQILMRRTTFVKFARRKARLEFRKNKSADRISWLDWLRAKTDRYWIMRKILGKSKTLLCMLCASPILKSVDAIKCSRPGCKGKYCKECFSEMENRCFLCAEPVEYGDFSDLSEERDSSDELEEIIVDKNMHDNGNEKH